MYFDCPYCKDTTWVQEQREDMQPIMRRCKCYLLKETDEMWKRAGLNPGQVQLTFSNFIPWNENSRDMKEIALGYYGEFNNIKKDRRNSIAFLGQVGSGKTHLSIALAVNLLKQKKVTAVYMPYRDIITKIKQNMLDEEYYRKTLSKYQTCEVLLIDDLFKGKVNETDVNIIFEIVNYRYLNYLPMIISSEYTLERLLSFDEAIGSRIYEMAKDYCIQVEGKENNYRLRAI